MSDYIRPIDVVDPFWNEDKEMKEHEIGICEHCGEPIHDWEDYYDLDDDLGILLHEDCLREYFEDNLKRSY